MGSISVIGFIMTVLIAAGHTESVDQDVFTKQMLLYKLNYQVKQMDQELFTRCPGFFTHPDHSSMGIIGRRAAYGDAFLDLEIKLASKTLDELKKKYLLCLENLSAFRGSTTNKPTTTSTSTTTSTTKRTTTMKPTTTTSAVDNGEFGFKVLRAKNITYKNYDFLVLEVRIPDDGQSKSVNWCRDYQLLCQSLSRRPTGCGEKFLSTSNYKNCASDYNSDMRIGDVLSCNPSFNVASAANLAFGDGKGPAKYNYNAFGFHVCNTHTCQKSIQKSDTALSYMRGSWKDNGTETIMYTLCR
ncbi:uncharacterized protein LOC106179028 [Lingula anatina]|uniref:Uncharacterized protein LOC106179028 n=1 Tax=Lingula anatina TaxID=7574 RepID=A0A1S3K634_LINAN|nr:uncharacterized protein LOC106179028 [Lingula anatina]|eukprot:XP_013417972.1 uncharacterized protein LOC106179028 [Lingula anatina]